MVLPALGADMYCTDKSGGMSAAYPGDVDCPQALEAEGFNLSTKEFLKPLRIVLRK